MSKRCHKVIKWWMLSWENWWQMVSVCSPVLPDCCHKKIITPYCHMHNWQQCLLAGFTSWGNKQLSLLINNNIIIPWTNVLHFYLPFANISSTLPANMLEIVWRVPPWLAYGSWLLLGYSFEWWDVLVYPHFLICWLGRWDYWEGGGVWVIIISVKMMQDYFPATSQFRNCSSQWHALKLFLWHCEARMQWRNQEQFLNLHDRAAFTSSWWS